MNQPRQPEDPPETGATPDDSLEHAPHGIPKGIEHGEAKGLPTSDRGETEKAHVKQ